MQQLNYIYKVTKIYEYVTKTDDFLTKWPTFENLVHIFFLLISKDIYQLHERNTITSLLLFRDQTEYNNRK